MSASSKVGQLIVDQAADHDASVLTWKGSELVVSLRLTLPSGRTLTYVLRIDTSSRDPVVREAATTHLPAFCPNRHINGDGSFCMGFPEDDALFVEDPEGAAVWWQRLLKFLTLQEMARKLRRWPSSHEWAHGPEAAWHQRRAERCANAIGPRFVTGLAHRRLRAKHGRRASGFVEMHEDSKRLYSAWKEQPRVATLRQACICGSGRPIFACRDHAGQAAALPIALLAMEKAEAAFWRLVSGKPCCGTLHDCPLCGSTASATHTEAA